MKKKSKVGLRLSIMVLLVLIIMLVVLLIFERSVSRVSNEMLVEATSYENYYVLIADESDSILWESVYEGAVEQGKEENYAYVEIIEDGVGVEYSVQDKIRIAIDSNVDGIILSADSTEETTELIDEAIEKGIPVVTVLNDDTQSLRKCYVGVNNYSLGEEYGEIIWEYISSEMEEEQDVTIAILMDANDMDTGKNTTYLGLKEYLDTMSKSEDWSYQINIEQVSIMRDDIFIAEETIGDIIVEDEVDIMVCLNAVDTETAYRTVVDYNLVGNLEILGYYESETILEAVEKDIIHSTITINGEEVGSQCVLALQELQNTGYVNGYFPISTQVINDKNIAEYLEKYEEVSEDEDE